MTRDMPSLLFRSAIIWALTAVPGAAQPARPASDPQTLSRGWAAFAAGRWDEAVSLADGILKRRPRSHAALSLKLEALSSSAQPLSALDAYEAWLSKAGRNVDDRGLLEPIAAGILRMYTTDADPAVAARALQLLAASGDDAALVALKKRSTDGDPAATLALVARGDPQAIAASQTMMGDATGRDKSAAVSVLAAHGGMTPALLDALRVDRVPMNRAAAARVLASSPSSASAQQLDELSKDPDPLVRTSVTLARAAAGDEQAMADARALLTSEVADLRLLAAEALAPTLPREADDAVRPLLADPDGLVRFRAARIIGPRDPSAVQSVITQGLSHENPLIQHEAGIVAAEALTGDLPLLRQLLRHRDHQIVVNAAGALAGS
jgi:HEAT repeat protein